MAGNQIDEIVLMLYQIFFERSPKENEAKYWAEFGESNSVSSLLKKFASSSEFRSRRNTRCYFPDGHFHSPIVNPADVKDYVQRERSSSIDSLSDINIDIDSMQQVWSDISPLIGEAPFGDQKIPELRYSYYGSPFPHGDALTLFGLIGSKRPRRIIEIGSGFSTACMLDAFDFFDIGECEIYCIEPNPNRLKNLLRNGDEKRVHLIQNNVQEVDLDLFSELETGDFLFIDSTHVLKTGSDVHFEFFHILPKMKSGVFVHFHDCRFPFEYPEKWIFEFNYSWNEIYALRALLTNNSKLRVFFWGTLFYQLFPEKVNSTNKDYGVNPGGSIWLEVM